ncbi:MAG: hypothetical protein ACRD0U_12940 [Acidimicrobiales bacterium]
MSERSERTFLERLIDDAGLFPPAQLPMRDALAAHAANQSGQWAWMLGRFLCPASRLDELAAELPESTTELRLSVILDTRALEADLDRVATAAASDDRITVELAEVRLPETTNDAVAGALDAAESSELPGPITMYLEPADSTDPAGLVSLVDGVAERRATSTGNPPGAKIRCGGQRVDLFPPPEAVAAFIDRCVDRVVPFKATAGLHHPHRQPDPATGALMHGFLNLVGGTALRGAGLISRAELVELIADEDPANITLDHEGFHWRGRSARAGDIHHARSVAFHAYGSCSFDEPVADLLALGILEESP